MNKHKVTVNGIEFTRNSKTRVYSHAIVVVRKGRTPRSANWTSRLDLADKEVRAIRKTHATYGVVDAVILVLENGAVVTTSDHE